MNDYSEKIEEMIVYKESLGYARRSYSCFLQDLSVFLSAKNVSNDFLRIEDIVPWCTKRGSEKPESYRRRLTAAREFTKYLYAMGQCDGILSTDIAPISQRYTPYIFTDTELSALFRECDEQKGNPQNPLYSEIISVIYRLIYFCGLRPNEGREIQRSDFDTEKGLLLIRKNKTHKERMIPVADDVAEFCCRYVEKRDILFPDSDYFFPAPSGKPYSAKWLTRHFIQLWKQACPEKADVRVRVYDLRHRYATAVLMDWMDQGEDLYAALPYLSAYMGHSDFRDTAYYIHLIPERLINTDAIDWDRFSEFIPEVAENE